MLTTHLTTSVRNFKKNKLHTAISIIGLGIGLATSLLALMFVLDEQSFDAFHSRKELLYRLNKITTETNGSTFRNAETSGLMGPTLVTDFPEVDKVVRYDPWYETVVLSNKEHNVELGEADILIVDSAFFEVFDFTLLRGSPKAVLTRPSTIVLTESLAKRLFSNEDPIGKTVTGINGLAYEVTGIAQEPPRNSHIQYKALVSWTSTVPGLGALNYEWMNNWIAQGITTYVLLKPGASLPQLQSKLPKFMQTHLPSRVSTYALYLQPFTDIYQDANEIKYHHMAKTGSRQYVFIFSVIAGFILFIACINYITISTSKATRRAKEVGMRKSLGASRRELIYQFLSESIVLTAFSSFLALALLYFAVPFFNELSGKSMPAALLWNWKALSGLGLLVLGVGVVAGFYPALFLSAFRPARVLKANGQSKLGGPWLRQALITFQFVISISMIACALLVYQQMDFIFSKDLGFDKDHVLVMTLTDDLREKGKTFADDVTRHPAIVSASLGRTALGNGGASTRIQPEGFPPDEVEVRMFPIDGNFMKTYDLKMKEGRFFNVPSMASDSDAVVINEALARRLNWDNALEKTIKFNPDDKKALPVIGVLKDFYFNSFYQEVEPLVMWVSKRKPSVLSVRFSGNPRTLLTHLESSWKKFESRYPFHYYFVDDAFAKAYQSEEKLFKTVIIFAALSLFIACLGLYGLVTFTIEQRTKEFGIRKVLGASVMNLNLLVNKKFVLLVMLASLMAVPAVIQLMNQWLGKFVLRVNIGAGIFLLAIGTTLFVTFFAVSIQAIKAAMMNPAKALRTE
jgi:putative ABC transport system permease protein